MTFPAEFRKELGITEESMLQVTLSEGALHLKPVHLTTERGEGSPSLKELYEYFAPAREEVLEKGYTEEEIDTAIDPALKAVRKPKQHGEL